MEQDKNDSMQKAGADDSSSRVMVYNFSKYSKMQDATRERLFASGESRGFVSQAQQPRMLTLDAQEINCLVESLSNYSGYLHSAIERSADLKSANVYNVRLSFAEGLLAKLTQ